MIAVKVTYKVKSEFALKNQENIRAFMKIFASSIVLTFAIAHTSAMMGKPLCIFPCTRTRTSKKRCWPWNRSRHFNCNGMKAGLRGRTQSNR